MPRILVLGEDDKIDDELLVAEENVGEKVQELYDELHVKPDNNTHNWSIEVKKD